MRVPISQRVHSKYVVDTTTGCWNWTGKINGDGYGVIAESKVDARAPQERRAHRVVYELLVGPIPAGLDLDHLCRVRHCVNPAHLEPVTRAENLRRGGGEHSGGKDQCKRGHAFTPENVYVTKAGYRNCKKCRRLRARVRRRLVLEGAPLGNLPDLF